MLPNDTEFKQTGVLPGEKVSMSFDENSLAHLASVLINLYSDKEKAVIREYSTNARDSHIEAGIDRPIEITTPSYLSYFFKVKDYGIGLSADDIRKIYSKYGASTKRETNDQIGMLGLGCKSGLTYTDQFTIVAVKDGTKVNVAVSRSEDGGGSMTILSESETTEPNGVEIIIPVARNNNFAAKCQQFFQYWGSDEVLINGKPPQKPRLTKISDRVHIKEDTGYYDKPVVIMGGVPYEIDQEQIKLPKGLVAFVGIGDVSFPPSREYLQYTSRTISTLNSLREEYKDNLAKTIQKEMDALDSKLEVIRLFNTWHNKLRYEDITISESDFTYQGVALQTKVSFEGCWRYGRGYSDSKWEHAIMTIAGDVVVYGFESDKLTSHQKQKLGLWAEENGLYRPNFYFCKDVPGDGWLDELEQLDWADILARKISRGTSEPKTEPTYEMYTGRKTASVKTLDNTKPILYSTKTEWKKLTGEGGKIDKAFPDVQFVFIGSNRRKKFLQLYPDAVTLHSGLKNLVQSFIDEMTDHQKEFLTSNEYEISRYGILDKTRLSDPDLIAIIEAGEKKSDILKFQSIWDDLCSMGWDLNIKDMYTMYSQKERTEWIDDRYPLLQVAINRVHYGVGQNYWQHVYLYLNSAYEEYKKGV